MSLLTPSPLDWARDGADWPGRRTSRFVDAAGLRWHVQVAGEGPAVLLLHGTGGASHSWRGIAPLLAADFTVIAPDLPGHGFTAPAPFAGRTLAGTAAGLGALCAALGLAPALLVGHSAGAAVAARMALDGRAAPQAIVAFNGAFLPFRGLAGALFPPMAKLLALNPLAPRAMALVARGRVVDQLLGAMGDGLDAEGRALYRRLFANAGHVAATLDMMAAWDLRPLARELHRLSVPVELVVGEADRAVPPADARAVAARLARSHVRVLAGLGHLAHEARPDMAAQIVREVYAATAPAAA